MNKQPASVSARGERNGNSPKSLISLEQIIRSDLIQSEPRREARCLDRTVVGRPEGDEALSQDCAKIIRLRLPPAGRQQQQQCNRFLIPVRKAPRRRKASLFGMVWYAMLCLSAMSEVRVSGTLSSSPFFFCIPSPLFLHPPPKCTALCGLPFSPSAQLNPLDRTLLYSALPFLCVVPSELVILALYYVHTPMHCACCSLH